jgi:carboxyl-terminal processing protease
MSRWNLAWLVGVAVVCVSGIAISQSAPLRERDKDYELVHLLIDVLSEVDHKYVKELDRDAKRKLVEDMINGGLERLDPHSAFINPKRYRQFAKDSRGKFGGIGIQISAEPKTGALVVVSPLVGTPAYEAGIQAGDYIVKIDGKSTENMTVNEAVDLIQGDPGQEIILTVIHENSGKTEDIKLVRAEIKIQSVLGDRRNDNNEWDFMYDKVNKIGYVRLIAFNETSCDELRTVLEQLERQGMTGLVLDLRNNPGGLLLAARDVADLFLTNGVIVSTKGRNRDEEVYQAREEGTILLPAKDHPIAVLINRYSASASEILAAALQDHGRAVVIGDRSYGKGSVQNVIKMENGQSALKLTTASYCRPSGHNIHRFPDMKDSDEWGVRPDEGFEVKLSDEEKLKYVEYRRKRDVVQGKPGLKSSTSRNDATRKDEVAQSDKDKENGKDKGGDKPAEEFKDRVLEKALEYLRGKLKKTQVGNG